MVDWVELDYAKEMTEPSGGPVYLRIVALIRRLITNGQLHEGDTLPTERDLAQRMGLSRGTVSLAYAELKREGIITATPGRGSRIATDQNVSSVSRKEQAIRVLSNALERLEALGFNQREVEAFLHLIQLGREGRELKVRAALVDCNPEALLLLNRQLLSVSHLSLVPFLLEDFQRQERSELDGFDLVLTTERHTPQVMGHLARLAFPLERMLSVAVLPTRETLIALARLPEHTPIVVQSCSLRFAEIIQQHLTSLGHSDVLVNPSHPQTTAHRLVVPAGTVQVEGSDPIFFDYQVDRGSLLRVEESVTALLLQKGEGLMGTH
ncbi:MAG: GntR family transcriptional regulator [Holophaga sp.]|nr:GntR family transcriptional regulator [Holophaga sp.]